MDTKAEPGVSAIQFEKEDDDDNFIKQEEKLPTNRIKAVIMISISSFFFVVYGALSKYSM